MDAMIFAAGLGTRLRPLTDSLPKALVPVAGAPVLDHVARRLVAAGATRLVINTHPFPGLIREHVARREGWGADVAFSHEPDAPLDTGGGLAQARPLFRGDVPFFMHNCDVLSDIDLHGLAAARERDDAMATLAVLPPSAERYLIFDDDGLCGFSPRGGGADRIVRDVTGEVRRYDFSGIHVASPGLLETLPDNGTFSIINHYLDLSVRGHRIAPFPQPHAWWTDVGTHEHLAAAEQHLIDAGGGADAKG